MIITSKEMDPLCISAKKWDLPLSGNKLDERVDAVIIIASVC